MMHAAGLCTSAALTTAQAVLRLAGLAARWAVPLAARAGQQQVMCRHICPVRLVQILANVRGTGMVRGMVLNSQRPVVGGPNNLSTCHGCSGTESARSGK